jgi:hypothetical protein
LFRRNKFKKKKFLDFNYNLRSLGIILYEMCTKEVPFKYNEIKTKLTPELPDKFSDFNGVLKK